MTLNTVGLLMWLSSVVIGLNCTIPIVRDGTPRQIVRIEKDQADPCIRQIASVWKVHGSRNVAVGLECERSSGWVDLYYETSDLGKTWRQIERSAVEGDPIQLGPHPSNRQVLYRIGGEVGVRLFLERSQDGGITWQKVRARLYESSEVLESYGFLAYHPREPWTIYAVAGVLGTKRQPPRSGPVGVYVSHDGGDTFSFLVGNIGPSELAISESRPETMYVGSFRQYLLKSDDGGNTWQFVGPCRQSVADCSAGSGSPGGEQATARRWINHVVIHPRDHRTVYASAGDGIWMTDDGGEHWCLMRVSPDVKSIGELVVVVNETEDAIFAGTDAGLFVSRDSGKTWSRSDLTLIR